MSVASLRPRSVCERAVDVLVVGAGGAGSAAAVAAASDGASVLLLSKDPLHCSDTKISEGNITVRASGSSSDTHQALINDLRVGGDDLGDVALTEAFAADARESYAWMRAQGLSAPKTAVGEPRAMAAPLGGHTLPRTVPHPNGGLDVGHAVAAAVQADAGIAVLEDVWCAELLQTEGGRVVGAMVYEASRGRWWRVRAGAVVLACGGLSTLYFPHTDTMRGNTGDAYALALRAGAGLVDMEQIQFLPFGIAYPPSMQGLCAGEPASAGPLGVLRDAEGRVILDALMARTRAECAAAIARAVAQGRGSPHGGAFLDLRANGEGDSGAVFRELLRQNAGTILSTVKRAMGVKAARLEEVWEVRPTAHYCMGGIRATPSGQALRSDGSELAGLFCAGQALGGLHGSNRLGSTSLAEGTIFGRRAGTAAARHARSEERGEPSAAEPTLPLEGRRGAPLRVVRELQRASWECLGPARTSEGLTQMGETLSRLEAELEACATPDVEPWNQPLLDWLEGRNMLLVARAVHASCVAREHSLGAHFRLDGAPAPRRRHSLCASLVDGRIRLSRLSRERTPMSATLRVGATKSVKMIVLKAARRLPRRARDRVLLTAYRRFAGPEGEGVSA